MTHSNLSDIIKSEFLEIVYHRIELTGVVVGKSNRWVKKTKQLAKRDLDEILVDNTIDRLPLDSYRAISEDIEEAEVSGKDFHSIGGLKEKINYVYEMKRTIHRYKSAFWSLKSAKFAVYLAAGLGLYESFQGHSLYALPLLGSAGLYYTGLHETKREDFLESRLTLPTKCAVLFGLITPALLMHDYFAGGNLGLVVEATANSIPSLGILGLNLYSKFRANYLKSKLTKRLCKVTEIADPLTVTKKIGRINYTLDQIQSIQYLINRATKEEKNQLEQEFVQFLEGGTSKSLRKKIESLGKLYKTVVVDHVRPRIQPIDTRPRVTEHTLWANLFRKSVNPEVYARLVSYDLEHDIALRLSKKLSLESIDTFVGTLRAAVNNDYVLLFQANPSIFFLGGHARKQYVMQLHKTTALLKSKFGEELPKDYSLRYNPVVYSTTDGLLAIEKTVSKPSIPPTEETQWKELLTKDGYDDLPLLESILIKGFQLQSSRPRIGMAYSNMVNIQKNAGRRQKDVQSFDRLFAKLIADGVILTNKEYKRGLCYSITSSMTHIKRPHLKEYVSHCLYETRRSGANA